MHMNPSWILKREMSSQPDQMGPQKPEGGWGTKGDEAGSCMVRMEGCLSQWPRMGHSLWAPVWVGDPEDIRGI